MLRPEHAEKRLKTFKLKNAHKRRLAELSKLPEDLAGAGLALLDRDPRSKTFTDWGKRQEAKRKAVATLDACPPEGRKQVWAALLPRMADAVEGAWVLQPTLPYQADYDQKAFRAPNNPEVYHERKADLIEEAVEELGEYDPEVVTPAWLAAWAPFLDYGGADCAPSLLAAIIDAGGPEGNEVFEILKDSATNQHEIGGMGRHVVQAMLQSSRPDAWEFVEKLLLAAQRQEGLRQTILESIDLAHPQAFRRMLRLVIEKDLLRFSAVVRALDVWLELGWDQTTPGKVSKALTEIVELLDNPAARDRAVREGDGQAVYHALWASACEDAVATIELCRGLLQDRKAERRFAAVSMLQKIALPQARPALLQATRDEDLRVAITAMDALRESALDDDLQPIDLFAHLVEMLPRLPEESRELKPLLWPWATVTTSREDLADELVDHLGQRPVGELFPFLGMMSGYGKGQVVSALRHKKGAWDDASRRVVFGLLNERDSYVREQALAALKKVKVTAEEIPVLEGALTRKAEAVRRGVLNVLRKQKDADALASVDRLLASKHANQRGAGVELLRLLAEKKRLAPACKERAENYRATRKKLSTEEQENLAPVLDPDRKVPTLDDALGLLDPTQCSPVVPPQKKKVAFITPAAVACLESLEALVTRHADDVFTVKDGGREEEMLLGDAGYHFPSPHARLSRDKDLARLPFRELWERWYNDRPKKCRDRDGLELVRAYLWLNVSNWDYATWKTFAGRSPENRAVVETLSGGHKPLDVEHVDVVGDVLRWLNERLFPIPEEEQAAYALDALEGALALVPEKELTRKVRRSDNMDHGWRNYGPLEMWTDFAEQFQERYTPEQKGRLWQLMHWRDRPYEKATRQRPNLAVLLGGYAAGKANDADLIDQLLGPRDAEDYSAFDDLEELTRRKEPEEFKQHPHPREVVDRVRERILEVELARGNTETAATVPARSIQCLWGIDTLFRLLEKFGAKLKFRPQDYLASKLDILTHLVRVTHPRPEDTPEAFADRARAAIRAGRLTQERLLELAFLAPQWVGHVEKALGWEGFTEGVWWFLAHMPYANSGVPDDEDEDFDEDDYLAMDDEDEEDDEEEDEAEHRGDEDMKLSPWERLIRERTPLTIEQRDEGAVDVNWFQRVYALLGAKRWKALAEAARYGGSSSQGAKKAIHLSRVLLGKASKRDLIQGIRRRFLKENVRLLGLMPLAAGDQREEDLHARYKVLQEYRRYARSLSAFSREDAIRTATIGMENLARTAGYPDPIRLEWAMEARDIADLAAGPLSQTVDGVTVTLRLDDRAQPELTVARGDKSLKAIPPKVRKDKKVAALAERKQDLKRQGSRMKESLEAAMIRGDTFTGTELVQLCGHPMLRPMLERLVLLGEGISGYVVEHGKGLRDPAGKVEPIKKDEKLRIAHSHDLYAAGHWDRWQHECFHAERVQPFKQVFRELYLLTPQEEKDGTQSQRYAGQQVNPGQAMALLGSRRWHTREDVFKTFYEADLTAHLDFRHHGWTPAQVEGLTVGEVHFSRRGEWKAIPLSEVPPRLFSEVMRDLDLVVSVAHLGGVDPEASASTVQMRAALLRETCELLGVNNVRFQGENHVLIDGQLGKYSVHLGSGVVHRQPGGSLCIVAVGAQHRGRLFLPFADDDPRTAEVISKVLLLARDHEIQDPIILDQIRGSSRR